jgi:hypothetical protein
MELTWNKQKRFPKYERMGVEWEQRQENRTLEFLQSLEALFTTLNAPASSFSLQMSPVSGITVMTLIA